MIWPRTSPSALVAVGRMNIRGNSGGTVRIKNQSLIHGLVLGLSLAGNSTKPEVSILSTSKVKGLIYSQGYTQLNGLVEGAVITDQFVEKHQSTTRDNILVDATIIPSKWYKNASHFSFLKGSSKQEIIKWLL